MWPDHSRRWWMDTKIVNNLCIPTLLYCLILQCMSNEYININDLLSRKNVNYRGNEE
jgi:hypothetical protein